MIDFSVLLNNPLVVGGGALGAFGAITYGIKSVVMNVADLVKREIVTSVEIRENDDSFDYLESFLSNSGYSDKNKSLSINTKWLDGNPKFCFSPSPGLHMFRDDGRFYWLTRDRQKLENTSSYNKAFTDTFYLNSFRANKETIKLFLDKCYNDFKKDKEINIYFWHDGYWQHCGRKDSSEPNKMILTQSQENIIEDAVKFKNSKEGYSNKGVPWRRGYLFSGPPGMGKSQISLEIAKKLQSNLYFVNLSDTELSDGILIKMFSQASKNSVVIMEEIDTVFQNREKVDKSFKSNSITFGGLLNVLDGVVAKEGRVVIMTTNHPELLDGALTRPGRIDTKLEFSHASLDQVSRMIDRFFGENNPREELKNKIFSLKPSMAQLQEWCLKYTDKEDDLMKELESIND